MFEFDETKHPHDYFLNWYLASQGEAKEQSLTQKVKVKSQQLLKNIFTQFVPALDRMQNNAFVLATASESGKPSSRIVLLKDYSQDGYVFYTNYESDKSKDLLSNPYASMNFFWAYPTRQIRIVGQVEKVSAKKSQLYWQSRPRGSQEGAIASEQSQVLKNYDELKAQLEQVQIKYKGQEIPCPDGWGGFIIRPQSYEFWEAMPNRLHKRLRFSKNNEGWQQDILSP